jgi:hypothetical protein
MGAYQKVKYTQEFSVGIFLVLLLQIKKNSYFCP